MRLNVAARRAARAAVALAEGVVRSASGRVGARARLAHAGPVAGAARAATTRRLRRGVTLTHGAGAVVARRGAQGRFLVAVRAVAPPKRKARTALGRTSKGRYAPMLLLREEIGSSVRYSKTLATAQARARRLLRIGPEAGQAREVVKCGGRWYCASDLVASGSQAMLVQQFVKGQAGQPVACNNKDPKTCALLATRSAGPVVEKYLQCPLRPAVCATTNTTEGRRVKRAEQQRAKRQKKRR
jgi:hypothetical protein